jgi:hypothetical protein
MKKLDLILIDPYDQSISRVDIDGSLESIYEVLQCRVIDIMNLADNGEYNIDLIMDDEGRLINNNRWFSWGGNSFAGRCLVASHNDDGDTDSCPLQISQIKNLEFLEEGYSEEPYMEFRPL